LGAVPRATKAALAEYFEEWAMLGIKAWDGPWYQSILDFCESIEAIIHGAPGTVVPMQNVTRGMAAVASCFDYSGPRNKIILTDLEFTTSYPFWRSMEGLGAEIEIIPSDDRIWVSTDRIVAAIDERTLLLPLSHAYFRSGALQDLGAIAAAAHRVGAYVLGDGYQLVGCVPVDVTELDVDFYVGGSHKWLCGGAGAGYLYVKPDVIGRLTPRLTGWFGLQDPFGYEPGTGGSGLHEGVFRFLGGTPNIPALYSAREGIRLIRRIGVEAIREISSQLTAHIITRADEAGFEIRTPRPLERRNGMVCLSFDGDQEATERLKAQNILVDWRPDCGIRLSPHFYNTTADIDRFFEALD
jgi:kynureninase